MIKITNNEFGQQLKELQDDKQSGLTGPFIHSAPKGNMHQGPFKEQAWMVGPDTVLKKTWSPEAGWLFYCSDTAGGRE